LLLYRIAQEAYAADFSGKGAWLNGGRWNSEGHFALYTSESRALALLETLAHVPAKMLNIKPYILVTLEVPVSVQKEKVQLKKLPQGWDITGPDLQTMQIGDSFLKRGKALMLGIPSVIMPEEFNYVLNPLHPDMGKVKITGRRRIRFDKRLL
jgi:RES domain-containing protein